MPLIKLTYRLNHYRDRDRDHLVMPPTTHVITNTQTSFRNHAGNHYESGDVLERMMPHNYEDQLWNQFWIENPNCLVIYNHYDEAAIRPTGLRGKSQKSILLPITPLYEQGGSKWEIKEKDGHYVYSLDRSSLGTSLQPLEQYFRPALNEKECNNHVKAFSNKTWKNPATEVVITPHHINPICQLILLQAQKYLGPSLSYVAFNSSKDEDFHIISTDDLNSEVITFKNYEVNKAAADLGFPDIAILHRFPRETNLDYSKRLTLFNKFIMAGAHISDSPFKGVYLGNAAFSYLRNTTANYDQFHSMLKVIHFLLHPNEYNDRVYSLVDMQGKTGWIFPPSKYLAGSIMDSKYSFRNSVCELLRGTFTLDRKTTFGDRKCSDEPFNQLVSWESIAKGCDANLKAESATGSAIGLRAKRGHWTKQLLEADVTQTAVEIVSATPVSTPLPARAQAPAAVRPNRSLQMLAINCNVGNPLALATAGNRDTETKRRRI